MCLDVWTLGKLVLFKNKHPKGHSFLQKWFFQSFGESRKTNFVFLWILQWETLVWVYLLALYPISVPHSFCISNELHPGLRSQQLTHHTPRDVPMEEPGRGLTWWQWGLRFVPLLICSGCSLHSCLHTQPGEHCMQRAVFPDLTLQPWQIYAN